MSHNIENKATFEGKTILFSFIDASTYEEFENITQCYGIVVNEENDVLIIKEFDHKKWFLPGGTVEKDETPLQTLHREIIEEADVLIKDEVLLGGQRVFVDGVFECSQLRWFARVKEILPQTPDPDSGEMVQRKFIPLSKLNSYLRWGAVGNHLVRRVREIL